MLTPSFAGRFRVVIIRIRIGLSIGGFSLIVGRGADFHALHLLRQGITLRIGSFIGHL